MTYEPNYDEDRAAAADWARDILARDDVLILDTETTGLNTEAEIVQLAIIDTEGEVILDTLIKPLDDIPAAATAIHGIDARRVRHAPYFETLWDVITEIIEDKTLIIYNAGFDVEILRQCCKRAFVPEVLEVVGLRDVKVHCAMHWYAQFVGDWNEYHGNYKWQRLPGGDHSALGDCRATLAVLKEMAAEAGNAG
jgi:DNA polymerase-3 subunit epsilon